MQKKAEKKRAPEHHVTTNAPATLAARMRDGIRIRVQPIPRLTRAIITDQSVDALHDLRVASRRLRAVMPLLAHTMSRRRIKPVAEKLKHLTRTLGVTREIDVDIDILKHLRPAVDTADHRAAAEHVLELFAARRDREHRRMIRKLNDLKVKRLRRNITELTRHIPESATTDDPRAADDALAPLIENAFAGLPALRQFERPEELHRMRIAVKRLRYALEWLSPAAPGGFTGLIQRLVTLQDCIGNHHDHFQLEATLTQIEHGLTERGRTALADGVRHCREQVSVERQHAYAKFLELTANVTASAIHHKARVALGWGEKRFEIGILPRRSPR